MFRTMVLLIFLIPMKVGADAGQRSCLPRSTAAQVLWRVKAKESSSMVEFLSKNVQLVGEHSGKTVHFRVRFDPAFQGVSLPYNLYAILIVQNGLPVAWWDYTNGCASPGLGFYPGREIELPKVNLIGGEADQLQIMVWGKL